MSDDGLGSPGSTAQPGIDRVHVYTQRLEAIKRETDRKLANQERELETLEAEIEREREKLRLADLKCEDLMERHGRLGAAVQTAQSRLEKLERSTEDLVNYIRTERTESISARPGSRVDSARSYHHYHDE